VKKCVEYDVEGQEEDRRGPGERLWKWTVKQLNGGCECVNVSSGTGAPR